MVNYVPAALIIFSVFASVFPGILMNRRFDQMDRRIDGVEQSLSNRIDRVEHRLELIEADQKQFFTVTAKM